MKYINFIEELKKGHYDKVITDDTLRIRTLNYNDPNNYRFNNDIKEFEAGKNEDGSYIGLSDKYTSLEILNLDIEPFLINSEPEKSDRDRAKEQVRKEIEDAYMDLTQELDACQGCIEDVNMLIEKTRIYSMVIEMLGGDIEKNFKEVLDRWIKKVNKQEKENEFPELDINSEKPLTWEEISRHNESLFRK